MISLVQRVAYAEARSRKQFVKPQLIPVARNSAKSRKGNKSESPGQFAPVFGLHRKHSVILVFTGCITANIALCPVQAKIKKRRPLRYGTGRTAIRQHIFFTEGVI